MKDLFYDSKNVGSRYFQQNIFKLYSEKMMLLDDIDNESYYLQYLNLETEKNSNQSFGICQISETDQYNSCIFDDSDVQKQNDDNQYKGAFTIKLNLNNNFSFLEKQEQESVKIPKLNKIKIKKNKKKRINKYKYIKIKNISKFNFESLALRNIKTNFATGLIQFIQFKQEIQIDQNENMKNLIKFMYMKLPALRSFSGWREIWKDNNYGYKIRKLSLLFFTKFYIYDYINGSRVKHDYKKEYIRKIPKFIQGAQNHHLFNSFNFNQ